MTGVRSEVGGLARCWTFISPVATWLSGRLARLCPFGGRVGRRAGLVGEREREREREREEEDILAQGREWFKARAKKVRERGPSNPGGATRASRGQSESCAIEQKGGYAVLHASIANAQNGDIGDLGARR